MSCPGEEVIAAFMQGEVAPTERSRIEAHLDVCPACTALLAGLGQVFGAEHTRTADDVSDEAESELQTLLRLQMAMAVLHLWGVVLVVAPVQRVLAALSRGPLTMFEVMTLAFGIWACLGLPWACANAIALHRRSRHAERAVWIYSLVATFSIFGTPFALFGLYLVTRPDVRRRLRRARRQPSSR